MLTVVILVVSLIYIVLSPLIMQIFDTILTLVFTVAHGGMVFVIQNVMNQYMIKDTIFTDEKDIVCNIILTYLPIFRTIAISVIVLIAAWQLFKTFFEYAGFSSEVEEPWKIGIKIMIFSTLVLESKNICRLAVGIFQSFMNEIKIDVFDFGFLNKWVDIFTGGSNGFNLGQGVLKYAESMGKGVIMSFIPKLIIFILLIIVDTKLLAVAINFAEKYLQAGFLIIISPLAFACGVAKSTSQILSSWVKLFSGTLISVFIKVLLMKILLEKGIGFVQDTALDLTGLGTIIKPIILIIAFTSLIEQSDQLTRELGFTIGASSRKTSDSLSRMMGKVI